MSERQRRGAESGQARRGRLRAAVVLLGLSAVTVLMTGAASAAEVGDFYSPARLGTASLLGLFIGVPLLGFAISGALAYGRGRGDRERYRPGRPWPHDEAWFGELPGDPAQGSKVALPGAGGGSGRW